MVTCAGLLVELVLLLFCSIPSHSLSFAKLVLLLSHSLTMVNAGNLGELNTYLADKSYIDGYVNFIIVFGIFYLIIKFYNILTNEKVVTIFTCI